MALNKSSEKTSLVPLESLTIEKHTAPNGSVTRMIKDGDKAHEKIVAYKDGATNGAQFDTKKIKDYFGISETIGVGNQDDRTSAAIMLYDSIVEATRNLESIYTQDDNEALILRITLPFEKATKIQEKIGKLFQQKQVESKEETPEKDLSA